MSIAIILLGVIVIYVAVTEKDRRTADYVGALGGLFLIGAGLVELAS